MPCRVSCSQSSPGTPKTGVSNIAGMHSSPADREYIAGHNRLPASLTKLSAIAHLLHHVIFFFSFSPPAYASHACRCSCRGSQTSSHGIRRRDWWCVLELYSRSLCNDFNIGIFLYCLVYQCNPMIIFVPHPFPFLGQIACRPNVCLYGGRFVESSAQSTTGSPVDFTYIYADGVRCTGIRLCKKDLWTRDAHR
jgi:hypothetical protein